MTRNLKALGLALVAAFAMSALAAQGASAANHDFHIDKPSANLIGHSEGTQEFKGGGASIKCAEATFTGKQSVQTATEVRLTPNYYPEKVGNCKLGAQNVTVEETGEGCQYVFTGQTTANGNTPREDAPVHLDCGTKETNSITITGAGVTIHFNDMHGEETVNQNLHGVKYTNITTPNGKEAVTADAHVFGIKYFCTGGVNCKLLGMKEGTNSDGTLLGNAVVEAFDTTTGAQINATTTVLP